MWKIWPINSSGRGRRIGLVLNQWECISRMALLSVNSGEHEACYLHLVTLTVPTVEPSASNSDIEILERF